jgi:hypothetical protein
VKGVNLILPVFRLSQGDRTRTIHEGVEKGRLLGVTFSCLAAIHHVVEMLC